MPAISRRKMKNSQVALLLFACQWLVRMLWRLRVDPDSSAIPVLTAMGDLMGTLLLSVAFLFITTAFTSVDLTVERLSRNELPT